MKYFWYILAIVVFSACSRELDDFIGEEVATASDQFEWKDSVSASTMHVDFTTDEVSIFGTMSEKVSWKVELLGIESNATAIYEDVDTSINVSWNGASMNVNHFKKGETVQALVSILGTDTPDTLWFIVDEVKAMDGILLSDFDGAGVITSTWWNIFKTGEKVAFSESYSDIAVPQGNACLHIKGTDLSPDKFIGQGGHSGIYDFQNEGFPENNDSLFFNAYVNGTSGTRLEVRLLQTVGGNLDGSEYSYMVDVNWEGWKLVSVPYSDFDRTGGDDSSPVKNAQSITRVKFVLRALIAGDDAEANIDYPVFTINQPFQQ